MGTHDINKGKSPRFCRTGDFCCAHVAAVPSEGGALFWKNRGLISQLAAKLRGLAEQYSENSENFRKI